MPLSRAEQELRNWRREHGVCLECGGKLEAPHLYSCCETCRHAQTEERMARRRLRIEMLMAEYAAEQESERQAKAEREARAKEVERCLHCVWAKYINSHVLFCPFAHCVRGGGE